MRRLSQVSVPTLVLWGVNDPIIPVSLGKSLKHQIPAAVFETITSCGHIPAEEKPAESADAIARFLSLK